MTYNYLKNTTKPSTKSIIDSLINDTKKIQNAVIKSNKTDKILAEYNAHNKRQFDTAMISNYVLRMTKGFEFLPEYENENRNHLRLITELKNIINRRTLKFHINKKLVRLSHFEAYKDDKECEFRLARMYSFIKFILYGRYELKHVINASTVYKSGVINVGKVTSLFNSIDVELKNEYFKTYHEFNEPIYLYSEYICGIYLLKNVSKNANLIVESEDEILNTNIHTLPILDELIGKSIDELDFIFAYLQVLFFKEKELESLVKSI